MHFSLTKVRIFLYSFIITKLKAHDPHQKYLMQYGLIMPFLENVCSFSLFSRRLVGSFSISFSFFVILVIFWSLSQNFDLVLIKYWKLWKFHTFNVVLYWLSICWFKTTHTYTNTLTCTHFQFEYTLQYNILKTKHFKFKYLGKNLVIG